MGTQLLCSCVGAGLGLRLEKLEGRAFTKSRLAPQPRRCPPLIILRQPQPWPLAAMASDGESSFSEPESSFTPPRLDDPLSDSKFCIIEGRETILDFAPLQLQELREQINMRRNKTFLLMEEVRRLRIQQRIKIADQGLKPDAEKDDVPDFPSFVPFLPPITPQTLKQYYTTCFLLITGIMLFAGLLAPSLELKLGVGGTSYAEFIRNMHLPEQLSQVDPIVASFSGGVVGVISALMIVELNNVKLQKHKRCTYCHGTGYLACARCSGSGLLVSMKSLVAAGNPDETLIVSSSTKCASCAGAAKVMCPTCLCTGMALASEHDPRIDPFTL